ncbi:MAG: hypothetical protein LKF96_06950 [Treponema sp.]|nr:hypothetical protein [Treponema sp.]
MLQSEIVLYTIKLIFGGIVAFLAIMLWSKTKDAAWMSLVAGAVTSYAGIVYEMMIDLGIIVPGGIYIAGIPLATLLFTIVPSVFFIIAFILMIIRTRY